MKKSFIVSLGVLSLFVVSCSNTNPNCTTVTHTTPTVTDTTPPTSTIVKPESKYTEKDITVYYGHTSEAHKVRFYEVAGDVPYLGIKDYYKILRKYDAPNRSDLAVSTTDNITYVLTAPNGYKATVNTSDDTLASRNYSDFINTSSYLIGMPNTAYDGSPWLQVESVKTFNVQQPRILRFKDYSIDIIPGDGDVYFPVVTLNDIFSGMNLLYSAYNNKDLYIINEGLNEKVPDPYNEELFKTPMTQSRLDYSYNEFCFFYDNFGGKPGRSALEVYYDLSKGFDAAMESTELGRLIKGYLHSTNLAEYMAGFEVLGKLLHDGGHTTVTCNFMIGVGDSVASWFNDDVYQDVVKKLTDVYARNDKEIDYAYSFNIGRESSSTVRKYRSQMLNVDKNVRGSKTYVEKGDTAMILLDDFMGDIYARDMWKEYYAGERNSIPYDETNGGVVSALYMGLSRAKANPNIKYVAIDIAANNGGSTDEVMYATSILTNDSRRNKFYYQNQLDHTIVETTFKVDRNLDKKFDEADEEFDAVGDLKVFVVASQASFSCGGLTPVYLRDYGLNVVGDISGGGSCAIIRRSEGVGPVSVFSSPFNIISPNTRTNIDFERNNICSVKFDKPLAEDGAYDYSKFYDLDYLSTVAKQLFE